MVVPKLRTYIKYKHNYAIEPYVKLVNNRGHRSVLSKFRTGILPLKIETGRFSSIPVEYRLCIFCPLNVVGDEFHFLLECECYKHLRNELFSKVRELYDDFDSMDQDVKVSVLMSTELVRKTAEFLYLAFEKRRGFLYE